MADGEKRDASCGARSASRDAARECSIELEIGKGKKDARVSARAVA